MFCEDNSFHCNYKNPMCLRKCRCNRRKYCNSGSIFLLVTFIILGLFLIFSQIFRDFSVRTNSVCYCGFYGCFCRDQMNLATIIDIILKIKYSLFDE